MLSTSVLNIDEDRCAVCCVTKSAFLWCDAFVDRVCICPLRKPNLNVRILQPEPGIDIRSDFIIGFDDVLDIYIDEIVEGIYMLFNEALDF